MLDAGEPDYLYCLQFRWLFGQWLRDGDLPIFVALPHYALGTYCCMIHKEKRMKRSGSFNIIQSL